MGIRCDINLFKPPDYEYRPGSAVRGVVKYVLSEDTQFSRITVSLKGDGRLSVTQTLLEAAKTQSLDRFGTCDKKETYVNIKNIALNNTEGNLIPAGTHEIPFCFMLPPNIPSNFKHFGPVDGFGVNCKIKYAITIKFERHGFFKQDKKFKSKIKVGSDVTAMLPSNPVTAKVQKKPFQPFTADDRIISINGTIDNSIAHSGEHIKISYKVDNFTRLDIKDVKVKLAEEIRFIYKGHLNDVTNNEHFSTCKTTPIKAGETQTMDLAVDIPASVVTLQHSKLVSRDYFVEIIADFATPHPKVVLKMPIEISRKASSDDSEEIIDDAGDFSPPSYCEAMQECKRGETEQT